jgi:hypothetical protein
VNSRIKRKLFRFFPESERLVLIIPSKLYFHNSFTSLTKALDLKLTKSVKIIEACIFI